VKHYKTVGRMFRDLQKQEDKKCGDRCPEGIPTVSKQLMAKSKSLKDIEQEL
jgi:hypothetical protein